MSTLLILICAAIAMGQDPEDALPPLNSPADIAAGAKTFRSHCSPCHGMDAGGGRGPNLASGVFYHGSSDADLLKNISKGIAGTEMPGLFYSSDRIRQVVAYLRSLNTSSQPGGDAARGRALFQSEGCGRCHRISGEGGRLGPDLTDIGEARSPRYLRESILNPDAYVAPRYWTVSYEDKNGKKWEGFLMNEDTYSVQFLDFQEQLHSIAKASLKNYRVQKTSKMPSYSEKLSSGQTEDLVAFLWSLRKERDSR